MSDGTAASHLYGQAANKNKPTFWKFLRQAEQSPGMVTYLAVPVPA